MEDMEGTGVEEGGMVVEEGKWLWRRGNGCGGGGCGGGGCGGG